MLTFIDAVKSVYYFIIKDLLLLVDINKIFTIVIIL